MPSSLDKLTLNYMQKFSEGVQAQACLLPLPSFVITQGSFLGAAKDFLHNRLLKKFEKLPEALESLDKHKMLTKEQAAQMILVRRSFANDNDVISMPKLAAAAKTHVIVEQFEKCFKESTQHIDKHCDKEEIKNFSSIQKLAATFWILQHKHPNASAIIRGKLSKTDNDLNAKATQALQELVRNPNMETIKNIYTNDSNLLKEKEPLFYDKVMQEDPKFGKLFAENKRDRYAEYEPWKFHSTNSMKLH